MLSKSSSKQSTTKSSTSSSSKSGRGRQVQARKRSPWPWVIGALVALLILAPVLYNLVSSSSSGTGNIQGVETFSNLSRDHSDQPQVYAQTPPVGGMHNPVWQNCGVYNQPIKNEHGVHSLEHGAVWITYRPDLPADQVDKLRETARARSYTILSPYPNLPSPVVASAWGVQLKLDNANDSRLASFISKYAQGPQTPEPGASCSGGTSETVAQ